MSWSSGNKTVPRIIFPLKNIYIYTVNILFKSWWIKSWIIYLSTIGTFWRLHIRISIFSFLKLQPVTSCSMFFELRDNFPHVFVCFMRTEVLPPEHQDVLFVFSLMKAKQHATKEAFIHKKQNRCHTESWCAYLVNTLPQTTDFLLVVACMQNHVKSNNTSLLRQSSWFGSHLQ